MRRKVYQSRTFAQRFRNDKTHLAGYGMVSYMLVAETGNWCLQTLSMIAAMYIIALIALAAIYSGLALSAIVGGFALGGCWLAICVTGSRTYSRLRSAGIRGPSLI